MKREITKFVARFLTCQKIKVKHQRPGGALQPIEILKWKLENITMDVIVGFPHTHKGFDVVWVVVDQIKKSIHFIPYRVTMKVAEMVDLYIREVVHIHGVLKSIIFNRDPRIASRLWK